LPVYPTFFLSAFAARYGCVTTHCGAALGPLLFGDGYVDQGTWWKAGGLFAFVSFVVHPYGGRIALLEGHWILVKPCNGVL
jgi:divalent anion:Na+ symporter, DASS family